MKQSAQVMKNSRLYIGLFAIVLLVTASCSTSRYRQQALRQEQDRGVYQSPDYYYTDQAQQPESSANSEYYADDYSDEQMVDEGYYDDYGELEYANRINRFYYNTPGMMYYDPWFDPWFGYSGFGLGYGWNMGYGWGWNVGFGWGYPYAGWGYSPWGWNSWGYNRWGWNSMYSNWGHPYYGYWGGGRNNYYYVGGSRYNRYASNRNPIGQRGRTAYNGGIRSGANGVRTSIQRDRNGRILNGTVAGRSSTARTTRGNVVGVDRNSVRQGQGAASTIRGERTRVQTGRVAPNRGTATPTTRTARPERSSTPSRVSTPTRSSAPARSSGSSISRGSSGGSSMGRSSGSAGRSGGGGSVSRGRR